MGNVFRVPFCLYRTFRRSTKPLREGSREGCLAETKIVLEQAYIYCSHLAFFYPLHGLRRLQNNQARGQEKIKYSWVCFTSGYDKKSVSWWPKGLHTPQNRRSPVDEVSGMIPNHKYIGNSAATHFVRCTTANNAIYVRLLCRYSSTRQHFEIVGTFWFDFCTKDKKPYINVLKLV